MKLSFCLHLIVGALYLQGASAQQAPTATSFSDQSLYFKVQLDSKTKVGALKVGDVAEGDLARDVYSSNGKVFAAGTHVRLPVDHLERRRRTPSNRWPWVVKVFTPRHQNFPVFTDAKISTPDGSQNLLHVSLLSIAPRIEVDARSKKKKEGNEAAILTSASDKTNGARSAVGPTVVFEANIPSDQIPSDPGAVAGATSGTIPAGTVCRILLLERLLASRNKPGDSFHARLLEPIVLDSHLVVPAGSVFEGKVTKVVPPRWLSRPGSLTLTFNSITMPGGDSIPVTASVVGVELNRGSHTRLDAEGRLRGEKPGAVWMLINGGATAGIAKVVDDGTQLVIEAILSSATDVSTAGTARIAASIVSGIFMLSRHGRDVLLPDHTEMNIMLNRPITATAERASAARVIP